MDIRLITEDIYDKARIQGFLVEEFLVINPSHLQEFNESLIIDGGYGYEDTDKLVSICPI